MAPLDSNDRIEELWKRSRAGARAGSPCFTSPTLRTFEDAIGNMLTINAGLELLGDRGLLSVEQSFFEACRNKAQTAVEELEMIVQVNPTPLLAEVFQFVRTVNDSSGAEREKAAVEKPAVDLARQLMPTFAATELTEAQTTLFGCRLALMQHDIERPERN